MSRHTASKIGSRFAIASVAAFMIGCSSNVAAEPSLIPALKELQPGISCIDVASTRDQLVQCVKPYGLDDNYRFSDEPRTTQDFQQQILAMWASMGRQPKMQVSRATFEQALKYASCVESATIALGGLSGFAGDPRNARGHGLGKAQASCASHPLSTETLVRQHPGILSAQPEPLKADAAQAYMLAKILSVSAYNYVIEAKGWVTDAMRPCVHYADGRAPSPSCEGLPKPIAPPPPPSLRQ